MKMRILLWTMLALASSALLANAQTATKPADETLNPIIEELGIPMADPALITQVLGLQSKPRGACDRARFAPSVTGVALETNCGIDLALHYSRAKDSTVQIFVRTRGTVLFGTAFKICHDVSKQCFYASSLHVAEIEDYAGVVASDNQTVQYTKVLGRNRAKDVVLLAVPSGDTRPALKIGARPKLNDPIFLVGHPYGFPGDVITAGQVAFEKAKASAKLPQDGSILTIDDLFVIDANVLEGNSGGPAFNAAGEVVGIDCMAFDAQPNLPNGGAVIVPIEEAVNLMNALVASQVVPTK